MTLPHLLIVDDDSDLLEALETALAGRGWRVSMAANGADALEVIRRELPALVLTDLEMPVMNGRQMLERLRADPRARHVPVVVLSVFGYEWEAELMGAQGYVRKPVSIDDLEQELRRVLAVVPDQSVVH